MAAARIEALELPRIIHESTFIDNTGFTTRLRFREDGSVAVCQWFTSVERDENDQWLILPTPRDVATFMEKFKEGLAKQS